MTTTKCWSITIVAVNKIIVADWHHFLEEVQLQEEGSPATVFNIFVIDLVPGVMGEAGNSFSELGADNGQSVGSVVALLMKGSCSETVL